MSSERITPTPLGFEINNAQRHFHTKNGKPRMDTMSVVTLVERFYESLADLSRNLDAPENRDAWEKLVSNGGVKVVVSFQEQD